MKKLFYLLGLAAIVASCNMPSKQSESKMEANKAGVQRFYDEVFNGHNLAMMDSFCTTDFVDHNPDAPHTGKGIEDVRANLKDFFTAYPDIHIKTNFMVASGDTVVSYITMTGTNSGAMGTMPPTNKSVEINGVDLLVIKDGKATERWGFFEEMKMMKQLGLMPEPGAMPDQSAMKPAEEKK